MAEPDKGFILTTEVLRRKPDSALIWYEDFRDDNPLPPATGQHLAASGRYGKIKMIPPVVPIRSLTGMAKWRGSIAGFQMFICGQGWPLLQRKWSCRHFVVMSFAV